MNLEQTLEYISETDDNTLFLLWTNADPVTAQLMVFMYAENSMKYHTWENLTIIIWGATAKLAAEDPEIRSKIRMLQEMGVHFSACITCAEELGVKDSLEELGIDLVKWLHPLTAILKGGKKLLTV